MQRTQRVAIALAVATSVLAAAPAFAAEFDNTLQAPGGIPRPAELPRGASANFPGNWSDRGMERSDSVRPGITGTVSAISGTTLTVTSKKMERERTGTSASVTATAAITYTIDASKATVIGKDNTTSSLSTIAVGDMVMVQGTVSGTNIVATAIRDVPAGTKPMMNKGEEGTGSGSIIKGNGQPVVGGSVTAINGSILTITNKSNVTYTVDVTNAVVQKGRATSTPSAIAVGDSVTVQGAVNGSSITASSVIDQGVATNAEGSGDKPGGMRGFFVGIGGFFAHLFGF